ncbi:hypothetical protein [Rhodovulum sp. YEN HP10]|uniref:hypothetical protein n=1 Tax=Rhodovulum sp. HP10 TaxID=3387397 RepID=UPI0039DFA81D
MTGSNVTVAPLESFDAQNRQRRPVDLIVVARFGLQPLFLPSPALTMGQIALPGRGQRWI